MVQTPKGVVSEKFGREEIEETDREAQRCAEVLGKAERKGQKRLHYLGDDTEKEEETDTEIEAKENTAEKLEGNNEERRIRGKERKLNREEKQMEKGTNEKKEDSKSGLKPQTFSELFYRTRKPSWPEDNTEKDRKLQEGIQGKTPIREKIRRWEGRTREVERVGKQGRKNMPIKRGGS